MLKNTKVFQKARYKCQTCGSSENLTRHHKKRKSKGGTNNHDNLKILCRECHDRKHNINSKEKSKRWTDEEIEKLMRRYKQGHSYLEISKELGRTRSSCYTMVHNVMTFNDVVSRNIRKLEIQNI